MVEFGIGNLGHETRDQFSKSYLGRRRAPVAFEMRKDGFRGLFHKVFASFYSLLANNQ